ncbi:TolC family protein [Desulfobulbus sp.]|uniref:TolC family protein n=1 Tax=Desulfobulbus sp. TaxID=895 RepID=UPI00286F7F89|nr:TolC family protein [Desulfobulbus sp.]
MNAERLAGLLFCALILGHPQNVHAEVLASVRELATPFQDPLLTAPDELAAGVALPGDGQPASCPASKDFSTPLALAEAIDLALCNNAQIKAAWADIKMQAANAGVARSAYLPTLSGSASYREDTTRYPDARIKTQRIDNYPLNASFAWRLFDFGGRGANHDAAMLNLVAALAYHNAVLQKTLATVVQDYFNAQVALAVWQAKKLNEEIANNTLEAAKRREAKGAGTSGDTLQATTALARATLEKNRSEGGYRKAMSVLLYGIGIAPQTKMTLASDLDAPSGRAAQDLEAWIREAKKRHPAIVAARSQLASARHQVAATRSEGLPTLDFTAGYYDNGRLEQSSTETRTQESVVALTLTFPLFEGFSRTYKVRASEAQVEQKAAELHDTEHQILMEMVKAHADAVAALHNLDASARLVEAAQEALRASQRKYDKGAADILEILNTQAAFADAQQERIRSLAEWRSARLRMLASAGLMSRSEVAQ